MKITNIQRKERIIKNISYLMRSRGETKASFSARSGLTRTTIYKILDGKVNNIQQSTINRISSFFSVSYDEIEFHDLEEIERKNETISINGNKNPSAIPIIPESCFISDINKTIGSLVTEYPLTYTFSNESNVIAMKVENSLCNMFSPGDILIVKRSSVSVTEALEVYITSQKDILIIKNTGRMEGNSNHNSENSKLIGYIVEERIQR